jgi:hypothetical protein
MSSLLYRINRKESVTETHALDGAIASIIRYVLPGFVSPDLIGEAPAFFDARIREMVVDTLGCNFAQFAVKHHEATGRTDTDDYSLDDEELRKRVERNVAYLHGPYGCGNVDLTVFCGGAITFDEKIYAELQHELISILVQYALDLLYVDRLCSGK